MQRNDLPRPVTDIDTYLHDLCLSLRALVDLSTPATPPAPAADAVTELREPAKAKARTRDELQAADALGGEHTHLNPAPGSYPLLTDQPAPTGSPEAPEPDAKAQSSTKAKAK